MKKGKGRNNGLLPNSLRIISSCLKTVSSNAGTVASTVRSAGASVAATISAASSEDQKDQVTWAGFDSLELSPSYIKPVLLLGYQNGFQVFDVEDASNFTELVSKRDGSVSFLQMRPYPATSEAREGSKAPQPLLLVVAGDDFDSSGTTQTGGFGKNGSIESAPRNSVNSPTTVQFYSLRSHCYVHVLRFRSAVCMVRCSPRIVSVGLATQIYCFDALTLESKFSVLTYPVPQLAGQGSDGINVGYGPMALGPRWLAYASNSPMVSNSGRLSSQNLSPSPGVSPSTSPSGGSLMARYAMESSKQLASGIINLGDLGYKTLSKYCQDLLPDGSNSPVSPSSGWKVGGRLAGTEIDNAGMVVIKDFVSQAIISQFKAHTSPISALCFDPSGTLLVTASIYGNNINIFRIMPSVTRCAESFPWSSSHVHLYKLHRGITTSMIQDICFSNYSQWVAIVSSKGTCHIFVLSPYGGDAGFQLLNSHGEEPSVYPFLSLPWWSSPSYATTQQSFPPPNPVSLSVVSRIKYSSFGWLSTANNSAPSPTGKVFVPSGAVAAIFHNSLPRTIERSNSRADSLEYLLVYTPSGHVVQHELRPSIGAEPSKGCSRPQSTSLVSTQEDELRVKVEPIQWWDVCRRSDWPEREDNPLASSFGRQELTETSQDKTGSDIVYGMHSLDVNAGFDKIKAYEKPNEMSHWYLSNAEVQMSALRLPIWHKSKICFYMMDCPRVDSSESGEIEIEQLPDHVIEMRQKELLPVFDHFHSIKSSWNDRVSHGVRYPTSTFPVLHNAEETVICHSKPASLSSTESSDGGSSRRIENFIDFEQANHERSYLATFHTPLNPERKENIYYFSVPTDESLTICSPSPHSQADCHPPSGVVEAPLSRSEQDSLNVGVLAEGSSIMHHPTDLGRLFREEHCNCKTLENNGCRGLDEVASDGVDSSMSHCRNEKPGLREDDEMLGAEFPFSE